MLRGENDRVNADRCAVPVVFHRDLRLAVGLEIGDRAVLANLGELLRHFVRQRDGKGHQLFGFVAGKAEHHALIARADHVNFAVAQTVLHFVGAIHAHGDVGGLFVDGGDDGAGVAVKAGFVAVIANADNDVARDLGNVDITVGGQLTHDRDKAGGDGGFASDMRLGVKFENRVQHRVGNLVAHLVRMPFRHGLGSK